MRFVMNIEKCKEQLKNWSNEIEDLKQKAYRAETTAQMDYYFKRILGLRSQHDATRRKLQEAPF